MTCEPTKDLELLLYKHEGLFGLKKKEKKNDTVLYYFVGLFQ